MSETPPPTNRHEDSSDVAPDVEQTLRALFQRTAPPVPPTDVDALLRQSSVSLPFFSRKYVKMSLRITLAATCAAAVLTVVALWQPVDAVANFTFADVQKEMQQAHTVTYTAATYENGQKTETVKFFVLAPHFLRIESAGGNWTLMDLKGRRSMTVSPEKKQVMIVEGLASLEAAPLNLYKWLRTISDEAVRRLPPREIEGEDYPGFVVKRRVEYEAEALFRETTYEIKVWVDPKTKLPVRMEMSPQQGSGRTVNTDFQFDQPLDEDLFTFEPPEGYEVKRYGVSELAPPAEKDAIQKPTLTPVVGLGPAKFGMSKEEVIEVLGKPDKVTSLGKHGVNLQYYSRGYVLTVYDTMGFLTVTAMSQRGIFVNVRDFAGQTAKGIKIGSTEKQVRQAYGEPSRVDDPTQPKSGRPTPLYTVLYYDKLGGWFSLSEDKVHSMVFTQPREDRRAREESRE